jgi:hypothetical protein
MIKPMIVAYMSVLSLSTPTNVFGQIFNFEKIALARIEAGTLVVDEGAGSWNRLLLVANTHLTRGDTEALAKNIRDSVSAFRLTLMAKVNQVSGALGTNALFQLQSVGVGYASTVRGKLTIVDVANASKLGLALDFASRQILSENDKQLANVSLVAMSPTVAVFDAPSLLHRKQKHLDFTMRHFLWLEAKSGRLTMLIWLLEKRPQNTPARVFDEPLRLVTLPVYEERDIHIDGSGFFLGIPSRQAFALEDLPPGKSISWTDELRTVAALERFDEGSLASLAHGLNAVLQPLRENRLDQ